MKNIFDYTKNTILQGMPAGNLVVKSPIDYDIGGWSYKTYDSEDNIRENLRNKWCSTIINLFIFDKDIQFEHVKNFMIEYLSLDIKQFIIYLRRFTVKSLKNFQFLMQCEFASQRVP